MRILEKRKRQDPSIFLWFFFVYLSQDMQVLSDEVNEINSPKKAAIFSFSTPTTSHDEKLMSRVTTSSISHSFVWLAFEAFPFMHERILSNSLSQNSWWSIKFKLNCIVRNEKFSLLFFFVLNFLIRHKFCLNFILDEGVKKMRQWICKQLFASLSSRFSRIEVFFLFLEQFFL